MTAAPLLSDDEHVIMLQKYISEGSRDLDLVTSLVGTVIESGAWSSFTDQLGQPVEHDSFRSFVETPRWRGLGTSKTALVGWVKAQDESAAEAVERAWRGEIPAARAASGRPTVNESAPPVSVRDHTADATVARLKRDNPALAERVVNGELTPHAAARLSGWRKPRVLITSPTSVCRRLADEWTADELIEAADLLTNAAEEKS